MRVLALTRNASLLVALGSMMREWEVVSVRDVPAAMETEPSAVALIDLGDTQEGLTAAIELYQQGITIPCVVLGDEPAEGATATILVRPFSLEDLATAVREASSRPAVPPMSPSKAKEPPRGSASEPLPDANGAETDSVPKTRSRTAQPSVEEPAKRPKSRPLTVVPQSETGERVAPAAASVVEKVQESELPEEAGTEYPETTPDPSEALPPQPVQPTPRVQSSPPTRGETLAASAAATAEIAEEPPQAQGKWRLRRKPARAAEVEESSESQLVRRLKQAATSAADLETLIEELPFLADLASMAEGLVAEVEAMFSAQVSSVFVRREDGYHAIAYRGLSKVESGMIVPETQPLFSDVLQTGEGILIQPVDLAQGLVAGIGGARTEALMAVPAVVHGACVAIVIVGQARFAESDLDRLSDLAIEAAPGLAVALALARLRERI